MKRKGMWKRWACAVLAVMIGMMSESVLGAQDETAVEWTYENSILVTVLTENEQNFTKDDFSEINCSSLQIVGKSVTEKGISYELVLTLESGNEAEINKAVQRLNQSEFIETAQRNERFAPPKSTVFLDKSAIYLKAGDTVDLSIQDVNLVENSFRNIGIAFSIKPGSGDESTFGKDSFLSYGISQFWPAMEMGEKILITCPEELEGQKSEDGKYYGLAVSDDSLFSTVNALAELPEITSVSVVRMAVPGGEPPYEEWTVNKTEILELNLSGGEIPPGFNEKGPRLNQTAAIKGIKPGIATVTVERGGFGAHASANCTVIVYESGSRNNPGDIDHDGEVSTDDALLALKHSVGQGSFDAAEEQTADLDQNGSVDVDDALLMLKIAVEGL